jgi:RHS repeat-associated protein
MPRSGGGDVAVRRGVRRVEVRQLHGPIGWEAPSPLRRIHQHGNRNAAAPHAPRRPRWPGFGSVAFLIAVALIAQGLQPAPVRRGTRVHLDQSKARPVSSPSPSGAYPPYPLNHTLDGVVTPMGSTSNADFEAAPYQVGSPPSNSDLEAAPLDVATVPNGDFETGDFSSWTVAGAPSIQTDGTHPHWAKLYHSGDALTSSAITVPSSAHALVYDIGYLTTSNYSWVDVYILYGTGFGSSVLAKRDSCSSCGYWSTSYIDLSAYRGQAIKVKFSWYGGTVGLDNVKVQQVFPGYDVSGQFARRQTTGGDTYADLRDGGVLITPAFTVDAETQSATVDLQKVGGLTPQYQIAVAPGPSFATFTSVASGTAPTAWQPISFSISAWRGQQVKVRVKPTYGWILADDVASIQRVDVPQWDISSGTTRIDDGAGGHYASTGGNVTSSALALPSGVQNVSVRVRSEGTSTTFYVELLRGTNFSTVVSLAYTSVGPSWTTLRYGVGPYAGEQVKLRVRWWSNGRLDADDAGLLEAQVPGWQPASTGAVVGGAGSYGTYATPATATGSIQVRSSWISPGIIDRVNTVDGRRYAISYDIGYSTGNLLQVYWYNAGGSNWNVYQDAANSPTGYRTRYFSIADFQGSTGYFLVLLAGGGKLYSLGDNAAREQLSEPYARKVGLGIDTSTGAVGFPDSDASVAGPLPLDFVRYYNAHSDRFGELGYRWSNTYDTRVEFTSSGNAAVVFGSGREEFFFKNNDGSYSAADSRVHSRFVANADATYTLSSKDNLSYLFTAQGTLTSITDLNGNALALTYDGQGRLVSVSGSGGTSLSLGYDGSGRLSTVTDPAGAAYTYGYDSNGDLSSVTDPLGGVRSYSYNRHLLTGVTDENGNVVVTNTYDEYGRITAQTDALDETITVSYGSPGRGATEVTDPGGGVATFYFDAYQRTTDAVDPSDRIISYVYDSIGNLDKIIDPANNTWDFAFNSSGDLTSTSDPLGNPTSIVYNPTHLPTTVTDSRGYITTMTYDSRGNLTSVTDPLGNVTTCTYDAAGNQTSATDPLGKTTTFTYDAAGNQMSKTDPLGHTWTYTYDLDGELTSETDPLGNITRYFYDLAGRVIAIRDPLGRQTIFLYDGPGHLLMVQDPLGHSTTWTYDDRGLVTAKTDAAGEVTTYGYDANRNMTAVTDPLGNETTYGYDSANHLASVTDPIGNSTTYSYDGAGRLASKTDALGRTTSYTYDLAGRLARVTQPGGGTLVYAYDGDGRLTSQTDPLGNETSYAYDAAGRVASSTDPLGSTTTYSYDAAGRLTSETDPLGHASTYILDAAGRLTSETDPLDEATAYGYDAAGHRTSVTEATGRATTYGYDAAGELVSVTDPSGATTTSSFDGAGRLDSVALPSGATTTYSYDSRGLMTSETDPLLRTTTYSYDAVRNMTSETDPLGNVTSYDHDDAGRLTSITDALGGVVAYGYDAAGQIASVTDSGGDTTAYGYDSLGDRTSVTDPLGRETSYGYDPSGRQTSRTDARGITTNYSYDAAGHPTSVSYPGGAVAYGYDAAGRQTSMSDPTGTTTFSHDAADRVTEVGAPAGTLGYAYDAAGRRTRLILPGGRAVDYAYDSGGRLASLEDWGGRTTTFGYDVDGNRTTIDRPDGVTSTYAYDSAGEVTSISHDGPAGPLLHFTYTYDTDGNRTGVTTTDGAETYAFDALGRLTHVAYADGSDVTYAYDPAGNRTRRTTDGVMTNYTYDEAGELTSAGGTEYTYDADGNLTSAGSDSFTWDFDNRLTSASVASHSASYTYDGDGVRVGATVDGDSANYLVDRQAGLPEVVDDGTSAYLHAGGVLGSVGGSSATYALTDALGSVRGLADGSGDLVGTASYGAFGETRTATGQGSLFGFTGEPADATGLTYLRARYLDSGSGRMLAADSVSPNAPGTQGYNLYAYARNNPTTWADPTGHAANFPILLAAQLAEVMAGLTLPEVIGIALFIIIAFAVAICVFTDFCWQLLQRFTNQIHQNGSASSDGKTTHKTDELENAEEEEPQTPDEPEPSPSPICLPSVCKIDKGWRVPHRGEIVYRVWGGSSSEWGSAWSPIDPRMLGPDKYRIEAGLPDRRNAGTGLTIARIRDPSMITPRASRRMDRPLSYCSYPGGLLEYVIPNAALVLDRVAWVPLSPPYGGPPPRGCP